MKRVSASQKKEVIKRAQGYCEYCRSSMSFSPDPFSVEHIVPQSLGGKTAPDNLALSCEGCNGSKYNKILGYDPVSELMVPLFNPRQQKWEDHFAWSQDFTLVIGLTPTGRATEKELRLNREGVVNLRRILYAAGAHPPSLK